MSANSKSSKRSELLHLANSPVQLAPALALTQNPTRVPTSSDSSSSSAKSQRDPSSNLQQQPTTRLVFGLSSRTNKVKHDEYAERRSRVRSSSPVSGPLSHTDSASIKNSNAAKIEATNNRQQTNSDATARVSASNTRPRASKYGNFYKPQDLLVSQQQQQQQQQQQLQQVSRAVKTQISKPFERSRPKSPVRVNDTKSQFKSTTTETGQATSNMKKHEETQQVIKLQPAEAQPTNTVQRRFNIPPPPQIGGTNVTGKSSMVSYAKSRIYDRPSKSPTAGERASLLDSCAIPESILSGFKPPKQVNVSKAREKWEGGEPFAKCKSRQRLQAAQQAAGKRLHGAWPMQSSMVATQQLQLQQQANGGPRPFSNSAGGDFGQPVKILTRGSVLERVQKFEKVPPSSVQLSSTDLPEDPIQVEQHEKKLQSEQPSLNGSTREQQVKTVTGGTSTRTGELLNQSPVISTSLSGLVNNVRRSSLTLRRRSSTTSNNSSTSSIPKFYHPNGKPNTYEIELQKKNIVAAFDKLPDRKAQLVGPSYRRHFHAIALACGFSEYFKEPLFLYVRHQLTESNLLHNTTAANTAMLANSRQHRVSNAGLTGGLSNSTSSSQPSSKKLASSLVRAASIDNSTVEKLQSQSYISCEQFLVCWRNIISCAFDLPARFLHLLTLGKRNYLLPDDLIPLIQSIIDDHPGLKFLRAAPDFHMRYIQTVIARIYFCINKSWTGKISLSELRQSNLLNVLRVLSVEEDINQVTDYFSYEHFYVIYCKFWSLDQDHDLLISKEDLARHNDAAISSRIIDRIFMGIVSKHIQKTGKMSYSDFVWFLIAEEDKKHPRSIEYWFRLMDIDGDGYISMYEMEYFYYEQMKRLELMNIEALPFIDSACQVLDLVNPKEKNKISLSDLKRTKLAPIFFDTFINLEKYLEHESREFVSSRDVTINGVVVSDWERYANEEYESLVTEETSV